MMKYKFAYLLNVVLYVLVCISCSKDENNNSNNFATGIVELPALRNGANDVFVTHYTTFNGQKVTSFSMDTIRVRNIPVGLPFDLTIKQSNKMYHVVMSLLMQILLSVHNTNVCKQILENKVMIEGIFVPLPTGFIHVR